MKNEILRYSIAIFFNICFILSVKQVSSQNPDILLDYKLYSQLQNELDDELGNNQNSTINNKYLIRDFFNSNKEK